MNKNTVIFKPDSEQYEIVSSTARHLTNIKFQKGSIKENGTNGVLIEDLLEVCMSRLRKYQKGKLPCEENKIALNCIQQALNALNDRTNDRIKRGVEGTYKS